MGQHLMNIASYKSVCRQQNRAGGFCSAPLPDNVVCRADLWLAVRAQGLSLGESWYKFSLDAVVKLQVTYTKENISLAYTVCIERLHT